MIGFEKYTSNQNMYTPRVSFFFKIITRASPRGFKTRFKFLNDVIFQKTQNINTGILRPKGSLSLVLCFAFVLFYFRFCFDFFFYFFVVQILHLDVFVLGRTVVTVPTVVDLAGFPSHLYI